VVTKVPQIIAEKQAGEMIPAPFSMVSTTISISPLHYMKEPASAQDKPPQKRRGSAVPSWGGRMAPKAKAPTMA